MELNNTARNRRVGYLGVAVATLLTPAGKLISSAVAAGVTVALITMSDPKVTDVPKTPVPNPVASSELIQEYFANELVDTSELAILETGADVLPIKDNAAGLQQTSTPSAVVSSSNNASSPTGGSLLDIPALGAGFGPPNILISNPQVDCEQVLKKDATERTELEKALCELQIAQTEDIKEEIVQLIAEVTLETGNSSGGNQPPLISNGGNQPPLVVINTSPQIPGDETTPPTGPNTPKPEAFVLPSEPVFRLANDVPVTIAAIPEPSTIGLLMLGLFSLGLVSRRTTGV